MPPSPSAIQSLPPPEILIGIVEYVVGSRLRALAFGADDAGTGNTVRPDAVADSPCPILALLHASAVFRRCTVSVLDTLWHPEWTSEGNPIKSLRFLIELSQSVYLTPSKEAPTLAHDALLSEYVDKSVAHLMVARYLKAQLELRSWVEKFLDENESPITRPRLDRDSDLLTFQGDVPEWCATELVLPILLSCEELFFKESRICGLNIANKAIHDMASEPILLASEVGHRVICFFCDKAAEQRRKHYKELRARLAEQRALFQVSLAAPIAVSVTSSDHLELSVAKRVFAMVGNLERDGTVTAEDAQALRVAIGQCGDLTHLQVQSLSCCEPTSILENPDSQSASSPT